MKTDPHLHLYDLKDHDPACFDKLAASNLGVVSSLWSADEWFYLLDKRRQGYRFGLSFGIHPQLPIRDHQDLLFQAAASGELCAIGECGWDFYDSREPALEALQDDLFVWQAGLAARHRLPLIMHLRRATAKIFQFVALLKAVPAVVFHSWPAPPEEGRSLLAKGVNAYFSLGTPLLQGNKKAARSLVELPEDRILMETDAPYQTLKGRTFTSLEDLTAVYRWAAEQKGVAEGDWEARIEGNFRRVFPQLF